MKGIIGKKIGMTSFVDESGKMRTCTVVEAGPCVVTQIKTTDTDGYNSVQMGFEDVKKNATKAALGHAKKGNTTPKRKTVEFRDFQNDQEATLGATITLDVFEEGDYVNVVGISKGKGFQGVVKRHGFAGVGMQTHGQHNRNRAPGSIGGASYPARVFKGMRMGGRMGSDRVKVQNLIVVKKYADRNLILVSGAVPGAKGSYLIIENA